MLGAEPAGARSPLNSPIGGASPHITSELPQTGGVLANAPPTAFTLSLAVPPAKNIRGLGHASLFPAKAQLRIPTSKICPKNVGGTSFPESGGFISATDQFSVALNGLAAFLELLLQISDNGTVRNMGGSTLARTGI